MLGLMELNLSNRSSINFFVGERFPTLPPSLYLHLSLFGTNAEGS